MLVAELALDTINITEGLLANTRTIKAVSVNIPTIKISTLIIKISMDTITKISIHIINRVVVSCRVAFWD